MKKNGIIIVGPPDNRNAALLEHLAASGFDIFPASTVEEMAEKLDASNWRIILIDCAIDNKNTQLATRHIRECFGQSVALIMLARSNRLVERLRAWRLGADAVLNNPAHIHEIRLVVEQLCLRLAHLDMPIQVN